MSQNSKIFLTDPLGHTLYDQHALPFALILLVMKGKKNQAETPLNFLHGNKLFYLNYKFFFSRFLV